MEKGLASECKDKIDTTLWRAKELCVSRACTHTHYTTYIKYIFDITSNDVEARRVVNARQAGIE